jgi:hypothetical protein
MAMDGRASKVHPVPRCCDQTKDSPVLGIVFRFDNQWRCIDGVVPCQTSDVVLDIWSKAIPRTQPGMLSIG